MRLLYGWAVFPRCRLDTHQGQVSQAVRPFLQMEGLNMSVGTILIVVLILILVGVLPTWSHSRSWGVFPSGIIGTILIVVLILVLLGRL